MKFARASTVVATFVCAAALCAGPVRLHAQGPESPGSTPPSSTPQEAGPRAAWYWLKQGQLRFSARYRLEAFERDGAPFTAPAYAPTLRATLGYETPAVHGFSLLAEAEAVAVTGPADYSVPLRPPQNRPDRPAILDPKSFELNQGYLLWTHKFSGKSVTATVGRQEIGLNDGRFLSISTWRQVHGTFDAARVDTELPHGFSLTYAFINHLYRVDGYDARDGSLPMHSHLWNFVWRKPDRARVAFYGLLLDYHSPSQFTNATQTYGARLTGPYKVNDDWGILYTAEYAKQKNFGANPNHVDANYYLGELGPVWRGVGVKAGYAFLAGHSPTDLLTTPAAPPFNGWTDLFVNNPVLGQAAGLDARYINASGKIPHLGGTVGTVIFYDYHSDNLHLHYGQEFDASLAYKVKKVSEKWEIGWRFGRYWADRLFTNAVRTSVYTSFTL